MNRYCEQCHRKLFPNESEICRLCQEYNEMTLMAHEVLYGREDREMAEAREQAYEDGITGFWDGDGWHDYD